MSVISGIGGHVSKDGTTKIPCVRTWGVTYNAGINEAVCSATQGARLRVEGNTDWTGNYTGYGALPDVLPGDTFEFNGAITGSGASAVGVEGDAICDSIQIDWDIEGGGIINHTVQFGADGALTFGTIDCPADDSIPDPPKAAGMKVEIAADPFTTFAEIAEVRTAQLTISKSNLPYTSSGTGSQTRRMEGNLDASLSLSVYAADSDGWASLPKPNDIYAVRLYTSISPAEYWLLKWMMFSELGGMDVDMEGGALVGGTLAAALNAFTDVSGTPTVGAITKPGGGNLWP